MTHVTYKILANYDENHDYKHKINPKFIPLFKTFQVDEEFRPCDLKRKAEKNSIFPNTVTTIGNIHNIVYKALETAKLIGLVDKISDENDIKYQEFLELDSIKSYIKRMRKPKQKHFDSVPLLGGLASGTYSNIRTLFNFSIWLSDIEITLTHNKPVKVDDDGIILSKLVKETIKIQNIEHLLNLYKESDTQSQREFQKVFFDYLTDSEHKGNVEGTMSNHRSRIVSYFKKNQVDLFIDYNAENDYNVSVNKDGSKSNLTLSILKKMMLFGKGSDVEKAVLMCSFQRGLDNSTMADAFNWEIWEQLVLHFETDDYKNWDLNQCPIPVYLIRMKTQFNHLGVLDRDAVSLIIRYLPIREKQTGQKMTVGQPLFLNKSKKPIKNSWISKLNIKLAREAKVLTVIKGYENSVRYGQNSHEKRDLLDSVLDDCGVKRSMIEITLAHKKSSYRKVHQYFKESSRREFMKASKALNIITGITNYLDGNDDSDELKLQIKEKISEMDKILEKRLDDEAERIRNEKFAIEQQRQMVKVLQEMENMKFEMKEIKSLTKIKSEKLEFCCISCEMVHDKDECPACGSKQRRIYEEKILSNN